MNVLKRFRTLIISPLRHEISLRWLFVAVVILLTGLLQARISLLNVSYDPTREFYQAYNAIFAEKWLAKTGEEVVVRQSHGGSGKQARSVLEGLPADVVSLALGYDIDAIARKGRGLLSTDWQSKLPDNSSPYTSAIVFLVRKGNPKGIHTWQDLIRPGVEIITPNPKVSGGARWNHLAAYGAAQRLGLDPEEYLREFYKHVPVLDSGARGATTTFVQRGLGDVLIAWENEAIMAEEELGADAFEIVVPPQTILAEPPVTVVEANAKRRGNFEVATAYLEGLYSPEAQRLAAQFGFRPRSTEGIPPEDLARFRDTEFFTLKDLATDWRDAQRRHFSDGGIFDRVFTR